MAFLKKFQLDINVTTKTLLLLKNHSTPHEGFIFVDWTMKKKLDKTFSRTILKRNLEFKLILENLSKGAFARAVSINVLIAILIEKTVNQRYLIPMHVPMFLI